MERRVLQELPDASRTLLVELFELPKAASVNSIVQAKPLCYFVQGVGPLSASPDAPQNPLGLVGVLQIFKVLQDRLASIVRLGAPAALAQAFQGVSQWIAEVG